MGIGSSRTARREEAAEAAGIEAAIKKALDELFKERYASDLIINIPPIEYDAESLQNVFRQHTSGSSIEDRVNARVYNAETTHTIPGLELENPNRSSPVKRTGFSVNQGVGG